jgi:hypothetical protein
MLSQDMRVLDKYSTRLDLPHEGNIRLMKADINLEGTSAGGCMRVFTTVY